MASTADVKNKHFQVYTTAKQPKKLFFFYKMKMFFILSNKIIQS